MKKIITISIFVMLLAFTTLLSKTAQAAAEIPLTENSATLCADGLDNDNNTLADLADPACASFASVPENNATLCADGLDNDNNTLADLADPACSAFAPVATTTATTTPVVPEVVTGGVVGSSFGGGSSSAGFGSGITSGTPVSAIATGTPISATGTEPVCAQMFKTFMKKGKANDTAEVKKLQKFLNVKVTGFFGNLTEAAVKAFQLKYKDSVLTPWKITAPTGYFYKTTQRQANLLLCASADIPMPVLN